MSTGHCLWAGACLLVSTGAYSVTEVKLLLTATHTSRLGGKHCKEFLARRQLVRSRLDWFAKLLPLHLSLHSVKCNVIEMSLGIGRIGNCLFLHLSHQCRETRCCTKFLQSNNWYQYIWNWKIGFTQTRKGKKVLTKFNWLFVRRFCHILIFSDACTHLYAPFLFFNLVDKLRVVGSSEITSNQEPRLQSTLTTRPVPHYPKLISPF